MHASETPSPDRPASCTFHWGRWLPAMALGPACAVVTGLLGWMLAWPAQYRAAAYLQVMASEPELANLRGKRQLVTQTAYDTFKNTQLGFMTNSQVLTAALRPADVADLPCVKRQKDPVAWLQEELQVCFPSEAEIMEVSMMGNDPKAVAKLVSAVVDAYLTEVVEHEQNQRRDRLRELNDVCTEMLTEVREKRNEQRRLAEQLGTPKSDIVRLKQESSLRTYTQLKQEHLRLQLALGNAEVGLTVQRTLLEGLPNVEISDAEVNAYARKVGVQATAEEISALRDQLREEIRATRRAECEEAIRQKTVEASVYSAREKHLAQDVAQQQKELERVGGSSVDLEMMEAEISNLDTVLRGLTAEREDLRVQLRSDARRIRVLQRAEPPLKKANLEARVGWTALAAFLGLVGPVCCVLSWRLTRRVMLLIDKL